MTLSSPLPKHMVALDGLRAVAISLVVLTHVGLSWMAALSIYQPISGLPNRFDIPLWLNTIALSGTNGVKLFFVVSAFTLTISLTDHPDLDAYTIRRFFRVVPAYWLAALAYMLLAGIGPRLQAPLGISPGDIGIALIFGSAWDGGASLAVVPGGWSVSCEVAFYLALPLILSVVKGKLSRAAMLTAIAFAFANTWARYNTDINGVLQFSFLVHPLEQAPTFLLGITAALWVRQRPLPGGGSVCLLLLAFAIFTLPLLPTYLGVQSYLWFSFFAAIAVAFAAVRPPRLLTGRTITYVGKISFSIYLVHFALLLPCLNLSSWMFPKMTFRTMALDMLLVMLSSVILANGFYQLIELPFIRIGHRVQPFARSSRRAVG